MSELAGIETVVLLQSVDLFVHCRAEEVLRIAAIVEERQFAAGETIYDVSDSADLLYCLVRGAVSLEGAGHPPRRIGPLQTFGVDEILSARLRASKAVAVEETLALAIAGDDFFDLLANNIEIVRALFRYVMDG